MENQNSRYERDRQENYHEDEIDLRDYINVVLKRKWSILGIFLVAVIAVVIISLTLPLTFEASNLVEIGQIKGSDLQSSADIQAVFNRETVLKQIKTKLQEPLELPETTTTGTIAGMFNIKKSEGFIEIKGRSDTPEKAVEVVRAVTDILLAYHQDIFAEAEKTYNIELETITKSKEKTQKDVGKIQQDIIRLDQDIQKYEQEIEKRANIQSEGQGRIAESYINLLAGVKNQKENKETQILNLEQQLVALDQSIQQKEYEKAYQTKPTKVEVPAIPPETRISPKRKQNVMIAGILGLFIGILYAFGAEYFKKT